MDAQVGARVKVRRRMPEMSQTELGNAVGVTFQQIQKYENGKDRISASRLQQFANVLKVDAAYFFEAGEKQTFAAAGLPAYVAQFAELPEGRRLMQAFMRMKDPNLRRNIRKLLDSLAG
jgi:transcriptional regulator with XRE-family HTH domain